MIVRFVNDTKIDLNEWAVDFEMYGVPAIGDAVEIDEELFLTVGVVWSPEDPEVDVTVIVTNEDCDHC